MNAYKRYMNGKRYLAKLNLLARTHKEVQPLIDAINRADDLLNSTSQESNGIESQGFTFDLSKYNQSFRLIESPRMDTPLANANDAWQSVRVASMDKATNEISPVLV